MLAFVHAAAALVGDGSALVVGGTGRVGGSAARWLHKTSRQDGEPLSIALGGRSTRSFAEASQRLGIDGLSFVPLDLDGARSDLLAAVQGRSLVVHTAGPFQQREDPVLLRACIEAGVPYVDVCDELALSRNAKALSAQAAARGVGAVVSCGIWPGVSALMAAEAVARLGGRGACERLEFSFHTAGTGGAGPTIVSATFLLLCTEVVTYVGGRLVGREPWTSKRVVDFGPGVGERACLLLDNPDVPTSAEALGVRDASSRFGTAPPVWNDLFGALKLLPASLLADRGAMQRLADFSMPIIRAVDSLVGATNAMRVDAFAADGRKVTLRVAHPDLQDCVGQATAAFGMELLRGGGGAEGSTIAPGVWYPAELGAEARASILSGARENAFIWEL